MSHAPLPLTPDHARRFHRRAVLLDAPVPDISAALAHLGYVQIDPINVCGRMHDLVLRQRVTGYREGGLHRYLHA
ncbi:MAG: winged helix-turn-helix domain-containing protein, partial [Opitutales bacterium]